MIPQTLLPSTEENRPPLPHRGVKPRAYVAGPYTAGDPETNTHKALALGDMLHGLGFVPFIPHLSHYWEARHPHTWDEWLTYDLEWLRLCHFVVRLPGPSVGADLEEAEARTLGIPVYHYQGGGIEELRQLLGLPEIVVAVEEHWDEPETHRCR